VNFKPGQILATTDTIPTVKGKLQAITDRRSRECGIDATLETLLDACNQIMPLASETVLRDLPSITVQERLLSFATGYYVAEN
jgi:hypothetical protein